MRFFVPGSLSLAILLGGGALLPLRAASAQTSNEWEENSSYYEDDAWYDITEWFDGNDYNPTDEQAFDLDDETYQATDDTGADQDNDTDYDYGYGDDYSYDYDYDYDADYADDYDYVYDPIQNEYEWRYDPYDYYDYDTDYDWFGYDNLNGDDNWFYDYYDDGYAYYRDWDDDGIYDYFTRYYDFDNDGSYDSYYSYYDWDDDGVFEDLNYFSFDDNSTGSSQQSQSSAQATAQAEQRSSSDATSHSISGSVNETKRVSLPTARHLVVSLQKNNGSTQTVDLGPVSALDDFDISQGDKITVQGPMLKVGNKPLLLAQQVKMNGQSKKIQRNRRKFTGEVADTRRMSVRGDEQHQLVILSSGSNKKRLVDLGPAERLNLDLQQGDRVSVRGTPAKFQDKQIVFANSITVNGETTQIDRRESSSDQQQSQTAARSGQQDRQSQRQNQQARRENDRSQRRNDNQQAQRQGQQSQQARQERRISGEVRAMRTVSLRGNQRKMATIETENGDQVAVDLGPADRLRADLQDGDQVTALGIPVRADGRRILVARQIETNGETIQIGRMRSQSNDGQQNQQAQVRKQRSVSGEVMSTRTVSVRGQQRKLAKIETQEGMLVIVDMGPSASLRNFDLAEGDQLNARGVPLKVRDQNILVAMQVRSGDQSVRVNRRPQGDQAQRNQTQNR